MQHFPQLAQQLRAVQGQLDQLPGSPAGPDAFDRLAEALEHCVRSCRQTKPTVHAGQAAPRRPPGRRRQLLQLYDAELTDDAIAAVRDAHRVLTMSGPAQRTPAPTPAEVAQAARRVAGHLAAGQPWRDIGALDADLTEIRARYVAERQRLLQWQEQQAEAARGRVKARDGFSTLTADQAHSVLPPLTGAVTDTTAEAIAPPLTALEDPFRLALQRAEDQANDLLDEILSDG